MARREGSGRVLRASGTLAALAASLCLVGCSVDATIVVTPDDMVSVDITTWFVYGRDIPTVAENEPADFDPCDDLRAVKGLVVTRTELPADNATSCHAFGRGPLASMSFNDLAIIHAGDRYVAILGRGLALMFSSGYQFEGLVARPSTIRLRLPGTIESTDSVGTAENGLVTWTSRTTDVEPGGLYASSTAPSLDRRVLVGAAAVGGLAIGALVAFGALRLSRPDAAGSSPADDDGEGDA